MANMSPLSFYHGIDLPREFDQLIDVTTLQDVPEDLDIDATILRVDARRMNCFEAQTEERDPPDFVELPCELLDRNTMAALERIYTGLELTEFEAAAPQFRAYLDHASNFRKNRIRGDARAVELARGSLGHWIENWAYQAPFAMSAER
jgi:hypothetical protein